MNKLYNLAQIKLHQRLIDSIQNEKRHFDMAFFSVDGEHDSTSDNPKPITCRTASCMYGHLVALYPKHAKALRAHGVHHVQDLAESIYAQVTGRYIPLQSYYTGMSRSEACAHIRGNSKQFPLAIKPNVDYE